MTKKPNEVAPEVDTDAQATEAAPEQKPVRHHPDDVAELLISVAHQHGYAIAAEEGFTLVGTFANIEVRHRYAGGKNG